MRPHEPQASGTCTLYGGCKTTVGAEYKLFVGGGITITAAGNVETRHAGVRSSVELVAERRRMPVLEVERHTVQAERPRQIRYGRRCGIGRRTLRDSFLGQAVPSHRERRRAVPTQALLLVCGFMQVTTGNGQQHGLPLRPWHRTGCTDPLSPRRLWPVARGGVDEADHHRRRRDCMCGEGVEKVKPLDQQGRVVGSEGRSRRSSDARAALEVGQERRSGGGRGRRRRAGVRKIWLSSRGFDQGQRRRRSADGDDLAVRSTSSWGRRVPCGGSGMARYLRCRRRARRERVDRRGRPGVLDASAGHPVAHQRDTSSPNGIARTQRAPYTVSALRAPRSDVRDSEDSERGSQLRRRVELEVKRHRRPKAHPPDARDKRLQVRSPRGRSDSGRRTTCRCSGSCRRRGAAALRAHGIHHLRARLEGPEHLVQLPIEPIFAGTHRSPPAPRPPVKLGSGWLSRTPPGRSRRSEAVADGGPSSLRPPEWCEGRRTGLRSLLVAGLRFAARARGLNGNDFKRKEGMGMQLHCYIRRLRLPRMSSHAVLLAPRR